MKLSIETFIGRDLRLRGLWDGDGKYCPLETIVIVVEEKFAVLTLQIAKF